MPAETADPRTPIRRCKSFGRHTPARPRPPGAADGHLKKVAKCIDVALELPHNQAHFSSLETAKMRLLSAGLLLVFGLGCSSPPAVTVPERLPLRHLAVLYGRYRASHKGMVPKDEAQFKEYIKSLDEKQLSSAGVSAAEIDSLFVSPRDNQPYDIRYNDPPPPDGPNGPSAVVVERVGKGGKRMVAYSMGKVEEIDDAKYQKIRFTK